jgi:hypothetical protein
MFSKVLYSSYGLKTMNQYQYTFKYNNGSTEPLLMRGVWDEVGTFVLANIFQFG